MSYIKGFANPALFQKPDTNARGAVHGDDVYVLASAKDLDEMNDLLSSKYSVRETHRLGFAPGCVREAVILNRVVRLGYENGRKFVQLRLHVRGDGGGCRDNDNCGDGEDVSGEGDRVVGCGDDVDDGDGQWWADANAWVHAASTT